MWNARDSADVLFPLSPLDASLVDNMQPFTLNDFCETRLQNKHTARELLGLQPSDNDDAVRLRFEELNVACNSPTSETHQLLENIHDKMCALRCLLHIALTGDLPRFDMVPATSQPYYFDRNQVPSTDQPPTTVQPPTTALHASLSVKPGDPDTAPHVFGNRPPDGSTRSKAATC